MMCLYRVDDSSLDGYNLLMLETILADTITINEMKRRMSKMVYEKCIFSYSKLRMLVSRL